MCQTTVPRPSELIAIRGMPRLSPLDYVRMKDRPVGDQPGTDGSGQASDANEEEDEEADLPF